MHKENSFTAKIPGYIRPDASSGGVSKSSLTHLAVQHQSESVAEWSPPPPREKLSKRQRGKCSSVVCAPPSLCKSLGGAQELKQGTSFLTLLTGGDAFTERAVP